jgi:hypothetical protein
MKRKESLEKHCKYSSQNGSINTECQLIKIKLPVKFRKAGGWGVGFRGMQTITFHLGNSIDNTPNFKSKVNEYVIWK